MLAECENCGFRKVFSIKEIKEGDDEYNPCPQCHSNDGWEILNSGRVTREDIANPYHDIPDDELLKRAKVVDLRDNHTVEHLPNGRIMVHPIDLTKIYQ